MAKIKCPECCYYDKRTGLCGFCMRRILRELNLIKEEEQDGDRQDETEGVE